MKHRNTISGDGSGTLAPELDQSAYTSASRELRAGEERLLANTAVIDPGTDFSRASVHEITRDVAYHGGPPELYFGGRFWERGKPLTVTETEWAAMQERSDFSHYDFRSE